MSFPDNNGYGWDHSDLKRIYHAYLSITDKVGSPPPSGGITNGNLPSGSLVFTLKQMRTSKSANVRNVEQMSGELVDSPEFPLHARVTTPYDISVGYDGKGEQAWVMIDLDKNINWRFTPGGFGISEKDEELGPGANFFLRHLSKSGNTWTGSKRVETKDCRTLVFGVAHRGGKNTGNPKDKGSCFVNLHVEFYQDEDQNGVAQRTLPIIIDPDVKNEGPDEFP